MHETDRNANMVLGGCHTLANIDGQMVGDPIEKQSFEGIKWKYNDALRESTGPQTKVTLLKKFLFESSLKRMAVVVNVQDTSGTKCRVLAKGAPEILEKYMKNVPKGYKECYQSYVKNGARVLAMAYKDI